MADNASDEAGGGATEPGGADTPTSVPEQTTSEPMTPGQAQEPATSARARRSRLGLRDMLLSMVVLGLGVLVLAAISQGFSFSPGSAASDTSDLPTVDVSGELQAAVSQVTFPVRQPRLPDGWRPNSDSVDPIGANGADQAIRIGWITPGGRYVQLSQSNGTSLDLVRSAAGLADGATVTPTGTETVNGTKWTVYPGVRSEQSWVTDLGRVRLFITGNGTEAEFRTLAVAALTGTPVTGAAGGS